MIHYGRHGYRIEPPLNVAEATEVLSERLDALTPTALDMPAVRRLSWAAEGLLGALKREGQA
jgi:hypothetical protein